jgi:hypothetical protein
MSFKEYLNEGKHAKLEGFFNHLVRQVRDDVKNKITAYHDINMSNLQSIAQCYRLVWDNDNLIKTLKQLQREVK